jgi:hypothetical protein
MPKARTSVNSVNTTLLRRTTMALAAVGFGFAAVGAQAQQVRLQSGSNYAECPSSTMSVTPNGTVTVTCSGSINASTGTTPTPGLPTFSLSTSGGTISAGSPAAVSVSRGAVADGTYTVGYSVAGAACATPGNYALSFPGGSLGSQQVPQSGTLSTAAAGTQCTVTITSAGGGTIGSPGIATYTIGGSNNPGPTVPAGCAASPAGMLTFQFADRYLHNEGFLTVAGQPGPVFSVPLPLLPTSAFRGQLVWMPSPRVNTPAENGRVEWSISKCPGQITLDPSDMCNFAGDMTYNSRNWIPRPIGSITSKEAARGIGACWAPESEGTWYLNARYTSPTGCPYGATLCGINWQWN